MIKRLVLTATLFLSFVSHAGNVKKIAFTFDDAPKEATGYFDGPTRAAKLIAELKYHNIKGAAFFANSSRLDSEGTKRLMAYANAGFIIANHTDSHPDVLKTELKDYIHDIDVAHQKLKDYPNFKPWFRFPYLREGDTPEKRDGIRQYLSENGYFNAYITLNNYDWYLEELFQEAIKNGQTIDFAKLKALYIDLLILGAEYYDLLAVKHLGRSVSHVMLLHEMDTTAMFVGDLADEFRRRGWEVISPEQAYQDEIAHYQTQTVLPYNPGRLGEIAKDSGQNKGLWHFTLEEKYIKRRFDWEVLVGAEE